ncbi:MAG TPA: ferritin-like domain-containing protein [Myxococcaceae bacterium]|nr:ferritin-like domain-containing protein [Myxococcaceae bacterium]
MTSARSAAAEAWGFRARVEQEAALRFDRLAAVVAGFDPGSPVPALMRRAAEDERRHTELCARLARTLGSPVTLEPAPDLPVIAPRALDERQAALYEVVAACCITETESMATLTTLLAGEPDPEVREVLHAISRDEVVHARMGWAHLARESSTAEVAFLSGLVPGMLAGTIDPGLFAPGPPEEDAEGLLRLGVLPLAKKREVFLGTLEQVVFPGLERFGVDSGPGRQWLAHAAGLG